MDETAARKKPGWSNKAAAIVAGGERTEDSVVGFGGEESVDDEACDGEAWNTLSRSFHQAQIVLDENRVLIQEVNNNHKSKIPDNMVKNVGLIRQINGNISKVLSIYSDLSTSFSNIVRQRRASAAVSAVSGESRAGEEDRTAEEDEHVQQKSEIVELMMAVGVHPYLH